MGNKVSVSYICVQEAEERLEINGTHQLLIYSDNINVLCENTNAIKKSKEVQLQRSV
jgi:hypothetical protein